ncbi:MAG: hypothetical protein J1F03_04405 [Oscillospiraceae bacterium]|nr:hypothetical protein [Oscillospiraceae bacterium]
METENKIIEGGAVENNAPEKKMTENENIESVKNDELEFLTVRLDEQRSQIESLRLKLFEAKTRLALMFSGIAKEKLDESAALAAGICKSGKTPEEAAREIADAYPHLKAVQRDIPQFAASGTGADDGFAAIRGIFAKR